ncbi:MarR family winged helix-turn-helix transcriptional regulator [Ligilactobacillus acidipiscis]|uniref:MarR family winged helix-turn-helix transcriptional regulator n=1 Tax=Ligilactobacillus acidipiscis TaxID=89059 RepID=UPI0022E77B80|nr:MarR family transcriptional regulator [Ligilactobacillus acidipiscis]
MNYYNFVDRPSKQRIKEIADEFNLTVEPDSVDLYLKFRLIYREIEKEYNLLFEKFNLSESRFTILMFLFYAKNKQLLPSEIANKLGVARPTISKMLKGMREQGLVERQAALDDKRVTYIQITMKGEGILKTFLPYNYQAVSLLFENFSTVEKEQFNFLLVKLLKGKDKFKKMEEKFNAKR